VAARDERGFQCAAITILQLVKAHRNRRGEVDGIELPGVMVRDWPALRRRGLMLDPARLKERNEYYAAVVDFIGAYKANALFLHLTDDTGIALQFPSHPSLATPHAFGPDDIASLVARGRRLGLDVVPEIESLGHAGAITRNPKYRALSEAGSNCLNPCLPETARLLDDLYADCAGVFPAQLLHCGMDEVGALGRSEECRRAYGQDPDRDDASIQDWAYARHVIAVHDLLAKRGKRMVMWGDMILRHREVARRIPKDILIDDWHYGTTVSAASAEFFIASGFEVIGSPALMCGNYRLMPSAANLRNVDEFTRVAQRHGLSGLNVTVWVPQRYLADAAWLSIARSCAVMWEGVADAEGGFDERRFLRAYVRRRFGLTPDDEIIAALRTLQELVPTHQQFLVLLPPDADGLRRLLESAELPAATEGLARPLHDDTAGIVRTLETRRDEVRRNVEEFESLVLVARIERHLGAMLDLAVNETPVPLDADGRATLQRRLDENDSLLEALNASWDRWRYPDTPGRVGEPQSLRSHWLNRYFEDFGNAARALLKASGRP
ncbi:MAG: family 20 glycosylhydrolase, partial [Armatimonadota bacterium]